EIEVPYTENPLTKRHEYIIVDQDGIPFHLSEYDSISDVNELLLKMTENNMPKQAMEAIGKSYLFSEIKEAFEEDDDPFEVIDPETSDDSDCGYALYRAGISYLPFEVPEDAEDYIRWEQAWYAAETDGWRLSCSNDNTPYIVRRMA
ncbi:MAG: antirestriction protein ArdA, partial [Lachnospiraceae bacterium]|nr:antirestriction protein ArdA [Lachnospiraceae bacterium]